MEIEKNWKGDDGYFGKDNRWRPLKTKLKVLKIEKKILKQKIELLNIEIKKRIKAGEK